MGDGCSLLLAPIGLNLNLSKNQDQTLCLKSTWGAKRESRVKEPKVRRDTPCADKDDQVWSTPTIMASEKWGYLLSIPNEGNHRVYIVLFMAERGRRVCVRQTVDVRPTVSSEGQGKEMKVFPLLSGALSFYFEWVHSDLFSQPDSFVFLLNYPGCATWTHLSMSLSVCWS